MSQSKSTSNESDGLFSASGLYLEQMYECYRSNPTSVAAEWVTFFSEIARDETERSSPSHQQILADLAPKASALAELVKPSTTQAGWDAEHKSRALYLIKAYRIHGHLHADLDPLNLNPRPESCELDPAYYDLNDSDLAQLFPTGNLAGKQQMPLHKILSLLKQTYCAHIGPEFMHITDSNRRHWIQRRLEQVCSTPDYDEQTRRHIFDRIMHAEEFEKFLHTRYVGQKRFSLEGGESLIPMLDTLIQNAGSTGGKEIIIGMAHRGRLNVLTNILGKALSDIFSEFEGQYLQEGASGQGDVKYHLGYSSDLKTPGGTVHLSLGFNPSHLEIITPVILGSTRARQCRRKDQARQSVLAVLVHGDAAFAGQGVVAESLELSKLEGFCTGGTIHIVVNNQIGFTVNPHDARSSTYCTDIAKIVQAPILHVNGDDPEACCLAIEVAVEYRNHFHEDIVIDLVCYRRHGHNESDAPEVTQPLMYRRIHEHPTVENVYRQQLINAGILTRADCKAMVRKYRNNLDQLRRDKDRPVPRAVNRLQQRWSGFVDQDAAEQYTAVKADMLAELARKVHRLPATFSMHPKVEKIYDSRIRMMEGKQDIDWGCAETMAYATILQQGGWVRLTGQDAGRGTFFHRHAVVYDQQTGKSMVPLKQLENGPLSHFTVINSMLSEMAVMGFEYGYSIAEPRALVIWEAQYGDFANVAQVVIDQFIAAGESKWSRMSGLVLWLPHGYEGQGAEHSSARLERYLQLCAEDNMLITSPTTPAQLFHLLRRQLMSKMRKPLIIMGPKSMLRNKLSFSSLEQFTSGGFYPVLPEPDDAVSPAGSRRLLLCSGKVYFDLLDERRKRGITDISMVRIERLYPFPALELRRRLEQYAETTEVVWVQEEPKNQGAWLQLNSPIRQVLLSGQKMYGLTRPEAAAPAVGSSIRHKQELQTLLDVALSQSIEGMWV